MWLKPIIAAIYQNHQLSRYNRRRQYKISIIGLIAVHFSERIGKM